MKQRTIVFFLILAIAMTFIVSAAGGGDDPLVSLSYLKTTLINPIASYIKSGADKLFNDSKAELDSRTSNGGALTEVEKDRLAAEAAAALGAGDGTLSVTLKKGDRVSGPLGGGFIIESGEGSVNSFTGNDLVNITDGIAAAPGTKVKAGGYYLVGIDNGCGMTITSDTATVTLMDGAYAFGGYTASHDDKAAVLQELGLFRGSDLGLELERAPTRQEALIMLIRLLGEEDLALSYTAGSPFTDLTGWGDGQKYIKFGANKGYTNGVTATTFNQYGAASHHVYLTYVLRALGYDDKNGDFIWDSTSGDLAVQIGLCTSAQLDQIKKDGFYRDHVVLISYNALRVVLKGQQMTLGEHLVDKGVITWDSYSKVK